MKAFWVAFWFSQKVQNASRDLLHHLQAYWSNDLEDGMQTTRSSQNVSWLLAHRNEIRRNLPTFSQKCHLSSFKRPWIYSIRHRKVGIPNSQNTWFQCDIPNCLQIFDENSKACECWWTHFQLSSLLNWILNAIRCISNNQSIARSKWSNVSSKVKFR